MKIDIAEGLRDTLITASTTLGWWATHSEEYDDLVKGLISLGFDVRLTSSSIDVNASGGRSLLIAAFKLLRANGFEPNRRPEEKDTYYCTFMNHKDPEMKSIWFSFSSTVCKRVQVGTEMKEVPVYEVQCGESMMVSDGDEVLES